MSENNSNKPKQELIFVPGTQLKEFVFPSGGSVLRLSINVEKFAKFVKEHKNEAGYINFNINKRREIGQFGDSHNMTLDLWKPTQKKSEDKSESKPAAPKKVVKPTPAPELDPSEVDDNF